MPVLEVTGIELGAAAIIPTILNILKDGSEFLDDFRQANEEAERLAGRMRSAHISVLQVAKIFFGPPSIEVNGQSCLFDRLDPAVQREIEALLLKFRDTLVYRYQSIQSKYQLAPPPDGQSSGTNTNISSLTTTPRLYSRTKASRASWTIWGKRKAKAIVGESELYSDRLRGFVLSSILDEISSSLIRPVKLIPKLQNAVEAEDLAKSDEAKTLDISSDIEVAMICSGITKVDWRQSNLEVFGIVVDSPVEVEESKQHKKELQSPCCGSMGGQRVVLDLKLVGVDWTQKDRKEPDPVILERIQMLTVQLHKQVSVRARTLPCRGLYRLVDTNTFSYVFLFPPACTTNPTSLRHVISREGQQFYARPALELRYKLATMLAAALFEFHSVGWLHKSIRSSNIIFFPITKGV